MSTDTSLPLFCSIPRFCELSGISRSLAYELIGDRKLTAKKLGAKTLVDVAASLAWMRSLPDAVIRMGSKKRDA
jgi:hypothetical protein